MSEWYIAFILGAASMFVGDLVYMLGRRFWRAFRDDPR